MLEHRGKHFAIQMQTSEVLVLYLVPCLWNSVVWSISKVVSAPVYHNRKVYITDVNVRKGQPVKYR